MKNRTLKFLSIVFVLLVLPVVTGTRGYKRPGSVRPVVRVYMENPDVDTFESIYRFTQSATATSMHCQCRGASSPVVTMRWKNNDGVPTLVHNDVNCDAEEDLLTLTGDVTFEPGDDLDLQITALSGTISDCSFFLYFE